MSAKTNPPLSGRRAQAARNDKLILDAARAVFVADPAAPIAAVATRAGVGIAALYRRYPSKEELLRHLASDGLQRYITAAEAALADEGDRWTALKMFMRRIVEEDTHSLTLSLAGTFRPTDELNRAAERSHQLLLQVFERTRAAGVLRPGVVADDVSLLFEQLAAIRIGDRERTEQLRLRYLALLLDGLHASNTAPLPGPGPTWGEIASRWDT